MKHWRCARCWGRVEHSYTRDVLTCRDCGHKVDAQAYGYWRARCSRPTGLVIGPARFYEDATIEAWRSRAGEVIHALNARDEVQRPEGSIRKTA